METQKGIDRKAPNVFGYQMRLILADGFSHWLTTKN